MWQEQVEGLGVFSLQGLREDPALVCTGHILGFLCGRDPWSRRGVCTQPAPASPGTLAGMPVLGPCMHLPNQSLGARRGFEQVSPRVWGLRWPGNTVGADGRGAGVRRRERATAGPRAREADSAQTRAQEGFCATP